MKDNTVYRYEQNDVRTLDDEQVLDRFRRTMSARYGDEKAARIIQTISNLELAADLNPLVKELF